MLVLAIVSGISGYGVRLASAQEVDTAATSPRLASMDADEVKALREAVAESGHTERTRQLVREGFASENMTAQLRALEVCDGSDEFESEAIDLYNSRPYGFSKYVFLDSIERGDSKFKGLRLKEFLKSEKDPSYRATLYRHIASADASQLDYLIGSLDSPDTSKEERRYIIGGFAHYPTTRTVEVLLDLWHYAPDEELRAAALGSLGLLSVYRLSYRRDGMVVELGDDGMPTKLKMNLNRMMFVFHDVPDMEEIDEPVCEILESIFLGAYNPGSEPVKKAILSVSAFITTTKSIALLRSVAADETAGDMQAYAKEQLESVSP